MTAAAPAITYSSPKELDVTTLRNYVAPENTLQAENKDWLSAKSRFYAFGEYHIFAEACVRKTPGSVELKVSETKVTDEQHDALLGLVLSTAVSTDPEPAEVALVEAMGIQAFYRYSSITHRRPNHGLAIILNDELVFVF